jgi:hypothetical protein
MVACHSGRSRDEKGDPHPNPLAFVVELIEVSGGFHHQAASFGVKHRILHTPLQRSDLCAELVQHLLLTNVCRRRC